MRLAGTLPEPGPQRAMVLASFVNRIGTGMFATTAVLYFTKVVHLSAAQVGTGLTLAGLLGTTAGVPVGDLADRHGPRTVQLVTLAVQTVTMLGFVVVRGFWAFLLVATLDQLADSANNAARGAVIARVGGAEPAKFRARLIAFVNLAVILGTLAAAVTLQLGTRSAYTALVLANAATYVMCALLLLRVPDYPALPRPAKERRLAALSDRPYVAFAALSGAFSVQAQALAVLLPVWIVDHTKAPRATVAIAFTVTSAVVVLLLTRIGSRVATVAQGGRAYRNAGILFLAATPLLAVASDVPGWAAVALLVTAVATAGVGTVWATSAGLALSFGLAPAHAQGQYQGLRVLGVDIGQAIGPVVLLTVCLPLGQVGWLLLGGFFAALGCLGTPLTRWAERSRAAERTDGFAAASAP
jgi:MFS family permease